MDEGHALILVVDADADVRRSVARLLEEEVAGVAVRGAREASQGLALLEQEWFALVISEHQMPGTDGVAFLKEARRMRSGLPTVLLTARPDPDLAAGAAEVASVVMAKPLDLDRLVAIAQAAVAGQGHPAGPAGPADPWVDRQ